MCTAHVRDVGKSNANQVESMKLTIGTSYRVLAVCGLWFDVELQVAGYKLQVSSRFDRDRFTIHDSRLPEKASGKQVEV